MALAPRFFNGDVAQMVELALHARGTGIALNLQFFRGAQIENGNTGSCFVRPKEDLDLYVHYAKGSIWNSTELAEKAIGPRYTKVYLRKTSKETLLWIKDIPLT